MLCYACQLEQSKNIIVISNVYLQSNYKSQIEKAQDMDKLRTSYKKYQSEVFADKPRFIAPDKVSKYSQMAQQELQKMQGQGEYQNYEEAVFYKEKFQSLHDIANNYEKKNIGEDNYHDSVRKVLEKDFNGKGPSSSVNPHNQITFSKVIQPSALRSKSKSPLKDFFDEQQMKNSKKVNFSNILMNNQTPLKLGLRSVSRSKINQSGIKMNDKQLRRLQQQNRRLKNQLEQGKSVVPVDDQRLRQLRNQVRDLDEQNRKLKSQVSKSSKSDFYVEEEYDPYNLKVRQNNIVKINNKNVYQSEKMSQYGGVSEDFFTKKGSQIYYDNQQGLVRSDLNHSPNFNNNSPVRRSNNLLDEQLLNSSQSTIQTQLLNLQNSELYDDDKNQICRQKIAFFKKSMVIAKGQNFDIAFKRSDFNSQMDKLRLILYVNNKENKKFNCSIEYDYDREDFEVNIKKKLIGVQARNQGRQEIEVYLKNASDLGSLITAKVLVGDKLKKIIVPTLFIDFDPDYKYQFQNIGYIERNIATPLIIKPMSQFSTIDKTSNILELQRQYDEKYQVGKLYGKSKACKGMVKFTWKNDKLKIDTCQEWKTLMGYLFLNAQESIHY